MSPLSDHEVAGLLAQETAEILVRVRDRAREDRVNSYRLQHLGDQVAHDHLMARLAELRPDDAVLSEEGHDDRRRLGEERVWIIDPLDGSQDYARYQSIEFAVHIALVAEGDAIAGAVSLPASGGLFGTQQTPVPNRARRDQPVVITSRSQWGDAEDVAAAIGGVVHSCGSAGYKAMAVVSGAADVYVHPSGLYEWDACAPAIVAEAAGLDVSGVDGSRLTYNKARPVVPGLLISRPEYTEAALGALHW